MCISAILSALLARSFLLTAFGDLSESLLLASVLIACLLNLPTTTRKARWFWGLMSLGFGLWLLAQILWTYFEVILRREVPNPFVGDVSLFLHLVPLMSALAVQPYLKRNERSGGLGLIDFVLVLVWWLYAYCFVVIPWQYIHFDEAIYGRSFDVVYIAEHAVLLLVAGFLWARSTGSWRIIYAHVFGASLLYALSSIAASVAIDFGAYYTGSFYDVPVNGALAWFTGLALIARGFSFSTPKQTEAKKTDEWMAWLATLAILSLPILAGLSQFGSKAPIDVRNFRLILTLGTMIAMSALLALKQYRLGKRLGLANQELEEASITDVLTGVKNRRFLTTLIEADISQVIRSSSVEKNGTRSNSDLIFYFIDVDHFKEVNDLHGHVAGDKVLIEIAQRISSAIRHSDVLIRWGGEEFLVVSRYTKRDEAEVLASRILHSVGTEAFSLLTGNKIHRTCSIGWAVFPWSVEKPEAVHYEKIMHFADSALYQAKNDGRNKAIGMLPGDDASSSAAIHDAQKFEGLTVRTLITLGPHRDSDTPSGMDLSLSLAAAASAKP